MSKDKTVKLIQYLKDWKNKPYDAPYIGVDDVNIIIPALERDIPTDTTKMDGTFYKCNKCEVKVYCTDSFCWGCGQRLNWRKEE